MNNFVHLRNHTEYSIVDSLIRINNLVEQAVKYQMPALAITDLTNFFGLVKFYRKCLANKIKPIIGTEIEVIDNTNNNIFRLILLAQNNDGYNNIIKLISNAYLNRTNHRAVIDKEVLLTNKSLNNNLIILSAGVDGDIGQFILNNQIEQAKQALEQYKSVFEDRFYIEVNKIQRPNKFIEEKYNNAVLKLASELAMPVVATNNVVFIDKQDYEAHDARVCINTGDILSDQKRIKNYTQEQYFKSSESMHKLFSDTPEVLVNSTEIARRCTVELNFSETFLPDFPTPDNLTIDEFLKQESYRGLNNRFDLIFKNKELSGIDKEKYINKLNQRLDIELTVINEMGFPGYFLIVADFIAWAKNNGVPVGPGRGSGAGSLVAFALGITNLNPLDYDLLFERFLNPERVSMPDFDIDFCMEGRDRVIEYVSNKYGKNAVSQIITFGTMAAKAVVRDVGRVLGHSYGFVDRIAKLIPFEIGMTLSKALEQEQALENIYNQEDEVKELIDLAKKLEGITRNVGKHAGGVVISPGDITNFTAVYCEDGSTSIVSQFDKDDIETIGLVKFDFLGLRTLTIINWAVQAVNKLINNNSIKNTEFINIDLINLDDKPTFDLLKACKTTAVFQLESSGMKDLIKRLQPDCFEDIIALVALFRPGPLQSGMVDDFIDRKHGRAEIEYPHPDLEPILKPTYGVILYQEQVMQIAQVLAGYSLGAADLLRRAMGKKKPEEMAKQREIFVTGALKNNIEQNTATYIFDLMEKFAGYGFNKSHSAAYALVSYQTAWLKTHYKEAFMAAVLSSDMDNTDKVVNFYEDALSLSIKILKPNVNYSYYKFICNNKLEIIYGLGAIKGLGESAIDLIIQERDANGLYKDLFDFCSRVDLRKVNKRALEALVRSGAMDALGPSRDVIFVNIGQAISYADQANKNQSQGQNDLFGLSTDIKDINNNNSHKWLDLKNRNNKHKWSNSELLQGERDTLGIFMSGHPLDDYKQELKELSISSIKNLKPGFNHSVIAGVIVGIRRIKTKSGDRLFIVTLDDKQSRIDLTLFGNEAERYADLIKKDKVIVAVGKVEEDNFTGGVRMRANQLMDMQAAKIAKTNSLRIILDKQLMLQSDLLDNLSTVLSEYSPGNCRVLFEYNDYNGRVIVVPEKKWKITLSQKLLDKLYMLIPEDNIKLQYKY